MRYSLKSIATRFVAIAEKALQNVFISRRGGSPRVKLVRERVLRSVGMGSFVCDDVSRGVALHLHQALCQASRIEDLLEAVEKKYPGHANAIRALHGAVHSGVARWMDRTYDDDLSNAASTQAHFERGRNALLRNPLSATRSDEWVDAVDFGPNGALTLESVRKLLSMCKIPEGKIEEIEEQYCNVRVPGGDAGDKVEAKELLRKDGRDEICRDPVRDVLTDINYNSDIHPATFRRCIDETAKTILRMIMPLQHRLIPREMGPRLDRRKFAATISGTNQKPFLASKRKLGELDVLVMVDVSGSVPDEAKDEALGVIWSVARKVNNPRCRMHFGFYFDGGHIMHSKYIMATEFERIKEYIQRNRATLRGCGQGLECPQSYDTVRFLEKYFKPSVPSLLILIGDGALDVERMEPFDRNFTMCSYLHVETEHDCGGKEWIGKLHGRGVYFNGHSTHEVLPSLVHELARRCNVV